jgi:hypothetical protein
LIDWIGWRIKGARSRYAMAEPFGSAIFTGTNRIFGRRAASQIA